MERFELYILGCGAALPTPHHFCSSQLLNVREKLFLIDCCEGVQMQLRHSRVKMQNINNIFITHLHGDHCFGLLPLLSTLALLGRTADIHVWGPIGLQSVFQPQIDYFCAGMTYTVHLHEVDHTAPSLILDDRSLTVTTLPLRHRTPCVGYLFREKPLLPHICRDAIDAFGIPVSQINNIKAGMDWTTPEGDIIPNHLLTTPAEPPRSYAYLSDTLYTPEIATHLHDIDLLYHEATFLSEHQHLAIQTYHSTTLQAAMMARECNARQLLIGHFSSRYNDENLLLHEAQTIFPNTLLASEGQRITINYNL
ncbi:MAG: ribonuclease Z [Bacteroidaceae bacterium]|nr:ribonuclease Z [Bacteroidaceae bacterium]